MAAMDIEEQFNIVDVKLTYDIFSILESNFLFSNNSSSDDPLLQHLMMMHCSSRVRILSLDAATDGGLLAALSLSRLEALLKKQSANPTACVADYFDVVAGSGAGGLLAAMLFTRGQDGRPLSTADEALRFLRSRRNNNKGMMMMLLRNNYSPALHNKNKLASVFSDATLRDSIKPMLISCFDLLTASPFMFSRSDAVESDSYNFFIKDVCAAACGGVEVRSVDGKTNIKAVGGGGVGTGNPTSAAITHVLNNKREFPFAFGPEDLLVVSLGSSAVAPAGKGKLSSTANMAKIAGEGATDTVDQSVAMAFRRQHSSTNYVRIQANGLVDQAKKKEAQSPELAALSQRYVESVMFRGKRISEETNGERLQWVATELIIEEDRRRKSNVPTVAIKPVTPVSHRGNNRYHMTSTGTSPSL